MTIASRNVDHDFVTIWECLKKGGLLETFEGEYGVPARHCIGMTYFKKCPYVHGQGLRASAFVVVTFLEVVVSWQQTILCQEQSLFIPSLVLYRSRRTQERNSSLSCWTLNPESVPYIHPVQDQDKLDIVIRPEVTIKVPVPAD